MFEGVAAAQLQVWLTEARDAYQALMTGAQVRTLIHGSKRMDFNRVTAPEILAYISRLQAALAATQAGQAPPRRSAIGVIF